MTRLQATSGHDKQSAKEATPRYTRSGSESKSITILAILLCVSIVVAVTFGPADVSVHEVYNSVVSRVGLAEPQLEALRDSIVWELRLPRVLTAAAVGAGLALCGGVMQAVTRNALADPYLLGLSSGASVGAVIALLSKATKFLPVGAFLGAMAALASTLTLAKLSGGLTPARMVLSGVAVSALGTAITSLLIFWNADGDSYRDILGWLMGTLSSAQWSSVGIALAALITIGVPIILYSRVLDTFTFGDVSAISLGVNVVAVRWAMLSGTALMTGCLVAVSGSIGFVGLVLPHAIRLISNGGYRKQLVLSALAGGVFLIWADTLARTVFDPRELPVGIVTALIGAPIFALLLIRRRDTQ